MHTTIGRRRPAPLPLHTIHPELHPEAAVFEPPAAEPPAVEPPAVVGLLDEQPVDAVVQSTKNVREVWQRGDEGEWWGTGSEAPLTSVDLAGRGPWRRIA